MPQRTPSHPAIFFEPAFFQIIHYSPDRPALIQTDKMEAILTEIDADRADGGWCGLV
jgi:hypothetical protein